MQEDKGFAVAQCAVFADVNSNDAIPCAFRDAEGLLVRSQGKSVREMEIVRDNDPFVGAGER